MNDEETVRGLSESDLRQLTAHEVSVAALMKAWLALDAENQMLFDAVRLLTIEDRIAFAVELLRSMHRAELLQGIQRLVETAEDYFDDDYLHSARIDLEIDNQRASSQIKEDVKALQAFQQFLIHTSGKVETTMLALRGEIYKPLSQCIQDETHLKECDDDGYCSECGEQD